MKLEFIYDIEHDMDNYVHMLINRQMPAYGRDKSKMWLLPWFAPEFNLEKVRQQPPGQQKKTVKKYIEESFRTKITTPANIKALEELWQQVGDSYIGDLKEYFCITDEKLNHATVRLTTLQICPWNLQERWFFVPVFHSLPQQIKTIMHELMHFFFLTAHTKRLEEAGLTKEQILTINEALVELLNSKFRKHVPIPETNHKPATDELKAIIRAEWEETDFNGLLDKLVLHIKRQD